MLDLKLYQERDEIDYNLYLRSINKPATCFNWDNPLKADGVPIYARCKSTYSDPNVKVSFNNFQVIQKNKAGYLASDVIRTYTEDIAEDVREKYKTFDNLNHFKSLLKRVMFSCTGWGTAYTLCYLDDLNQARIKQINAWNAKVIYDDNGEPQTGYIYYKDEDDKRLHVFEYDKLYQREYLGSKNGASYELIEEKIHGFGEIPLIEWSNNFNKQGNAELAVSLMDAYDRLISDNITEAATFRSAYLLLKNLGLIDENTKAEMQKTGVFFGGDNAEAKFLTKDINPEYIKFIVDKTWGGIWVVASSVDPQALASLTNATAFQISQMYRNMEEDCKDTETEWLVSLEYLDRVLKSFWTSLSSPSVKDYDTLNINYDFKRNIPKDVMTWLKDVLAAGGKLPQSEILLKAGYSEDKAKELKEAYINESYEELPE